MPSLASRASAYLSLPRRSISDVCFGRARCHGVVGRSCPACTCAGLCGAFVRGAPADDLDRRDDACEAPGAVSARQAPPQA
jgi:hypothetical protein